MTTIRLVTAAGLVLLVSPLAAMGQAIPPPPRPAESAEAMKRDPDPAQVKQIIDDMGARKAKEAVAQVTELLRSYPDSIWLNCAAGEAAVVGEDRLSLHSALDRVKGLAPNEPCVLRLERQYKQMVDLMTDPDIREQALDLVKAGNLDGARKLVADAHFDPYDDLLLEYYLDLAQTHFMNALIRLNQLEKADPTAADDVRSMKEETLQDAKDFSAERKRVQTYLYDPVATSSCTRDSALEMFGRKEMDLTQFFNDAQDLIREYPSHPDVQQIYFMAQVLAGSDEGVKRYGASVLERYGKLTIPFFSRDALYLLVLDRRQRRITLKENPEHPKNMGITDGLRVGQTFDLSYSGVASIRQVVSSNLPTWSLSEKSAAFDLGDQGLAPYYALMPAIHCIYGESYERRATARLGKFLAQEIGLPNDRVKLVNPDAMTHDVLGNIVSIGTAVTMAASSFGAQREQDIPVEKQSLSQVLGLNQFAADQTQNQGQEILDQRQNETGALQEMNGAQKDEAASLEEQLAEQGFDRAFDLDVPGYLEILTNMLRNRN